MNDFNRSSITDLFHSDWWSIEIIHWLDWDSYSSSIFAKAMNSSLIGTEKKTSLSWLINDFFLRPLLWACWVVSFHPTQRNSTCGNTNTRSWRSFLQFMSTDMNWLPHRWTCSSLYFPQEQSFSVRARESSLFYPLFFILLFRKPHETNTLQFLFDICEFLLIYS